MRIAISMRVISTITYPETRDAISHDWQDWFNKKGHKFFPIPNIHPDVGAYLSDVRANAVVLSGGNDFVARDGHAGDVSEARNKSEHALLSAAVASELPILATCRGLHVVNNYFSGGTTPDLTTTDWQVNHVANNHAIKLLKTGGIPPLYSGATTTNPLSFFMVSTNAVTVFGIPFSDSS